MPDADATQALPATGRLAPRTAGEPLPPQRARTPERRRPDPETARRRRASFIALALILILIGVAAAILISSSGGQPFTDINASNSRDQSQQLIQYVRQHERTK